jgi:hypothetical protein
VSPVKYELGFYIPEDGILHSHCHKTSNLIQRQCFSCPLLFFFRKVRAGSLQDLVYKGGQAGITKASVTLTFDNRDKKQSPLGYEHYEEITVTRQVRYNFMVTH